MIGWIDWSKYDGRRLKRAWGGYTTTSADGNGSDGGWLVSTNGLPFENISTPCAFDLRSTWREAFPPDGTLGHMNVQ